MTRQTEKKSRKPGQKDASRTYIEKTFLECYHQLKAVISGYLKRPEDIEDIVQETFIRTYEARQQSRISNLKAYFFTTARNLSLKHKALHTNKITDSLADLRISEVFDDRLSIEAEYQVHERFNIFCEAVRELPLQCRRVLILKKIYGLSHEEIAEKLNVTVSTTNQHLAKAIARCTLYMREHGYLEEVQKDCRKRLKDGARK